jgi:hypothetical protein
MKVIILVLSSNLPQYQILENAIRSTWDSVKNKNIEVYYYYGESKENTIIEDKIYTSSPEGYSNIGEKTITAFELIKDKNFDYLFRTNSSSYIIKENLLNFLEDKPKENFYTGIIGKHSNINFCSGSGYFLSKNLVVDIIKNKNLWNHNYIDDVAISELITKKMGVAITDCAKRLDIHSLKRIYTLEDIKLNYHIRCAWHSDRSVDVFHMKKIHSMLNDAQFED